MFKCFNQTLFTACTNCHWQTTVLVFFPSQSVSLFCWCGTVTLSAFFLVVYTLNNNIATCFMLQHSSFSFRVLMEWKMLLNCHVFRSHFTLSQFCLIFWFCNVLYQQCRNTFSYLTLFFLTKQVSCSKQSKHLINTFLNTFLLHMFHVSLTVTWLLCIFSLSCTNDLRWVFTHQNYFLLPLVNPQSTNEKRSVSWWFVKFHFYLHM